MSTRWLLRNAKDGNLIEFVPPLPGCDTKGRTLDEVLERAREAIELMLEEIGDGDPPEANLSPFTE